ncbi:hypothetical protein COLO4_37442 [Corchorus olitorius]|uniref:Uncharacterized protein n=1 Tax=Corchorus olitorius TaxID=93759 RepID=A0A1R3G1L9_9ROSI|nr:hypothetical protein COLO4_37442 [Corchorus olitorius]
MDEHRNLQKVSPGLPLPRSVVGLANPWLKRHEISINNLLLASPDLPLQPPVGLPLEGCSAERCGGRVESVRFFPVYGGEMMRGFFSERGVVRGCESVEERESRDYPEGSRLCEDEFV